MSLVDSELVKLFIGCYILIILFLCIVVQRSQMKLTSKVFWLVLVLCLPVIGVFLYIMSITFKEPKIT